MNEIDMSPVQFACLDDKFLFAQVGTEIKAKHLSAELPENIGFILNDLITVVDFAGPFSEVKPAIVTVTDKHGHQIKDWKFSCRRLDISLNFFNKGYFLLIEIGAFKQRLELSWDLYKNRLIPADAVFH